MTQRFKPIAWRDMPFAARKAILRVKAYLPGERRIRGWQWFVPFCDGRTYAVSREMKWFVAGEQ